MSQIDQLAEVMKDVGLSAEKAAESFQNFSRLIPPYTKADILAVKANPSLSSFEKYRIIRSMKKQMVGDSYSTK